MIMNLYRLSKAKRILIFNIALLLFVCSSSMANGVNDQDSLPITLNIAEFATVVIQPDTIITPGIAGNTTPNSIHLVIDEDLIIDQNGWENVVGDIIQVNVLLEVINNVPVTITFDNSFFLTPDNGSGSTISASVNLGYSISDGTLSFAPGSSVLDVPVDGLDGVANLTVEFEHEWEPSDPAGQYSGAIGITISI